MGDGVKVMLALFLSIVLIGLMFVKTDIVKTEQVADMVKAGMEPSKARCAVYGECGGKENE